MVTQLVLTQSKRTHQRMNTYVGSTGRANLDDKSWEELHTSHISVPQ